MSDQLEILAAQLRASPDYRVLRRLQQPARYCADVAPEHMRRALLVDVETTGLSHTDDVIIELGMILFTFDKSTGNVCEVVRAESWLQDPGRPIPEEISRLTGITDADVQGEQLDEQAIRDMVTGVSLIIAHNAGFDRPFIDQRLPFLANLHWGCSQNDVPWKLLNRGSQKLDYLLYQHTSTFLDTHHRALDDCRATLHVLATAFDDAQTPLKMLLENCRAPRVRVSAVGASFDVKDLLRKRGYSWSGDAGKPPKTWCREILAEELDAEFAWMQQAVYNNASRSPLVEKVDLRRRYAAS
jgi:DNA polymerase III subunit epsilon